ncbi:MAG: response regulator transcription factor [Rhodobacteraceae bacterium]|nr:response regulator transcription factor [Paracoccaceae bacterium]
MKSRRSRSLSVGRLTLDVATRTAQVDGTPVPLTSREYEVLEFLTLMKGVVLTKDMILDKLYGGVDEPDAKIVDVFICKIRRKLRAASGGEPLIETVWGRGYVLRAPGHRVMDLSAVPPRRRRMHG